MRRFLITSLAVAIFAMGTHAAETNAPASLAELCEKFSPDAFRELPRAKASIQITNYDAAVAAAAIFHETNRRRAGEKLPALGFHAASFEAARLQAAAMAKYSFMSHENPHDPKLKTLEDRARVAGLNYAFIAENVAQSFAVKYRSGTSFYQRTIQGKTVATTAPNGPPIPAHTYVSFAEALLEQWMNSPGHRHNILHESPRYLGCSALPASNKSLLPEIYSGQVFFTPLR